MKPWFIKENNVIPFPKKDTGVVKLPNVNAYPDFLSGVQDLQNHLKNGDISSDIHKKLYQDLTLITDAVDPEPYNLWGDDDDDTSNN